MQPLRTEMISFSRVVLRTCSNIQCSTAKLAKARDFISKGPFVLDLNAPLTPSLNEQLSNYYFDIWGEVEIITMFFQTPK